MTTYKDIRGTHIKTVTTDPPAPVNGQMWYNSTSQVMKGLVSNPAGSWSTGGTLNTARQLGQSGAGTRDAALVAGGEPDTGKTEEYNGTAWTEVADLNTARRNNATVGANTEAALSFAGFTPPGAYALNEQWNGSSWTEIADLNTAGRARQGSGTTTAALAFGGGPSATTDTETWNGSAWTEVNNLNTARYYFGASGYGSNTATLAFGGETNITNNELWNGTNWTETADLNEGRRLLCGAGTSTAALAFGGFDGSSSVNSTELWNGSSWAEQNNLSVARHELGGTGADNGAAIGAGGYAPSGSAVTTASEEWAAPVTSTVTFTAS